MRFDDRDLTRSKPAKKSASLRMKKRSIEEPSTGKHSAGAFPVQPRTDKKEWIRLIDVCFNGVLYALVFLLPIFFLPFTADVLELNKQMLLVAGTGLLSVLGGVRMLLSGTIELRLSPVYAGFAGVIGAWLLASAFSRYPYNSLLGVDRQEYASALTVVSLIVLALILMHAVREKALYMLGSLVASLSVASLLGVGSLLGYFLLPWDFTKTNAFTVSGSTDIWGVLAAVALLLSIGLIGSLSLSNHPLKVRASLALAASSGINIIALILLGDWRLWLAVALGLTIFIGVLFARLREQKTLPWLILPSFVLVLSLAFAIIHPPRLVELPLTVHPTWKTSALLAWHTVAHSPLWGFGPGSFLESYTQFRPQEINSVNYLGLWNTRLNQASALVFTLAANLGVLGILSILVLLFLLGKKAFQYFSSRELGSEYLLVLSASSALALLLFASFLKPGSMALLSLYSILAGVLLAHIPAKVLVVNSDNSNRFLILSSVLASAVCVAFLGTLVVGAQRYAGELTFDNALMIDQRLAQRANAGESLSGDDVEALIQKLSAAVVRNPHVDTYYRTLSQAYFTRVTGLAQSTQDFGAMQVATESMLSAAKKAVELSPSDVRNHENLATLYQQIAMFTGGADSFALESFKKAESLDPKNPSIPLQRARMLLELSGLHFSRANAEKDQNKKAELSDVAAKLLSSAEADLHKAEALKSDLPQTAYYLALIRSQNGDKKEAVNLLKKAGERNVALVQARASDAGLFTSIATVLASLGESVSALDTVRAGLSLRPDDQQALWLYANLLSEAGKKADAVAVLGKMLEKNPQNEQVIKRLQELQSNPPPQPDETQAKEEPEEKKEE